MGHWRCRETHSCWVHHRAFRLELRFESSCEQRTFSPTSLLKGCEGKFPLLHYLATALGHASVSVCGNIWTTPGIHIGFTRIPAAMPALISSNFSMGVSAEMAIVV